MSGQRPDEEIVLHFLRGFFLSVVFWAGVSFWFFFFAPIAAKEKEQANVTQLLHCEALQGRCPDDPPKALPMENRVLNHPFFQSF